MDTSINFALLILLIFIAVVIVRQKYLFSAVIMMSLFSLLSALLFISMDALDVALTEAAVGAGVSSLLFFVTLALTGVDDQYVESSHRSVVALITVTFVGAVLFYGVIDMPGFGEHDVPVHTYLSPYYLVGTVTDIGIPNTVTAVLASYRGYDTFGEVVVIFTALIGVLMLLGNRSHIVLRDSKLMNNSILTFAAKVLIPLILLFALYVQFHGDYSPGGGFQAGVLFASAFIVFGLIFGLQRLAEVICLEWIKRLAAVGVLLYAGVGIVSILQGGKFLEYKILADKSQTGEHLGILLVELGVGITVATTMILLFYLFFSYRHKAYS